MDFPRRMREWLFNVMQELADRRELSYHYQLLKKEAEVKVSFNFYGYSYLSVFLGLRVSLTGLFMISYQNSFMSFFLLFYNRLLHFFFCLLFDPLSIVSLGGGRNVEFQNVDRPKISERRNGLFS